MLKSSLAKYQIQSVLESHLKVMLGGKSYWTLYVQIRVISINTVKRAFQRLDIDGAIPNSTQGNRRRFYIRVARYMPHLSTIQQWEKPIHRIFILKLSFSTELKLSVWLCLLSFYYVYVLCLYYVCCLFMSLLCLLSSNVDKLQKFQLQDYTVWLIGFAKDG